MKKTLIISIIVCMSHISFLIFSASADSSSLTIIPQVENTDKLNEAIQAVGQTPGSVVDNYNQQAQKLAQEGEEGCALQIASGIRDRGTILCYAVMLVSFLSQIGITIGALMIIYAGYIYATAVFNGGNAAAGKTAISRAIIGILVIVFSYAIVRIVTRAFLY